VAEGARLESVYTLTGIGGSNPSLSASSKRVKTADGLRYCAVAHSSSSRLKVHYVLLNGREEHNPEGSSTWIGTMMTAEIVSVGLSETTPSWRTLG
jgi:hypothetical protein